MTSRIIKAVPDFVIALLFAAPLFIARPANADVIEYTLGGDLTLSFQGKISITGRSIQFKHDKFGKVYFPLTDDKVKRYMAPTTKEKYAKIVGKATSSKDAKEMIEAARWALRHGLLAECYVAIDKAREFDPMNPEAQRLFELRKSMDVDLGDSKAQEQQLRETIRSRGMKIAKSKHFIMIHDTPDEPAEGRKKTRSEERLELLETVYQSFLLKFLAQGSELEIPKERLMVVLFNDHQDFLDYATSESPALASAAGFWNSKTNVAVFYDHSTTKLFQALQEIADELTEASKEAVRIKALNAAEIVQQKGMISMLLQVERENSDIEVVTHECTHQMAGNTGLLPRHVQIPSWVHEGLATYFESPKEAAWSGVGAVNEGRIRYYRALERDREHSNIDFIVGDQIFDYAGGSHGNVLHAYGQSWALTHFLMEEHFQELMTFYRRLGEMPPDIIFSPDALTKLFNASFPGKRKTLDTEWRGYMRDLKTDLEEITD